MEWSREEIGLLTGVVAMHAVVAWQLLRRWRRGRGKRAKTKAEQIGRTANDESPTESGTPDTVVETPLPDTPSALTNDVPRAVIARQPFETEVSPGAVQVEPEQEKSGVVYSPEERAQRVTGIRIGMMRDAINTPPDEKIQEENYAQLNEEIQEEINAQWDDELMNEINDHLNEEIQAQLSEEYQEEMNAELEKEINDEWASVLPVEDDAPFEWEVEPTIPSEELVGLLLFNEEGTGRAWGLGSGKRPAQTQHADISLHSKDDEGLPNTLVQYAPILRGRDVQQRTTYPLLDLPVANAFVKGTRKGRSGPRGVSEAAFHRRIAASFPAHVLNDHRLPFDGATRDYEPDVILHFEDKGLRIDIEVDEPYSGATRKPMHWKGCYDDDRDLYFSTNGWVVIRFAEIQVVQQPEACLAYLADLIDEFLGTDLASAWKGTEALRKVERWTHEQAKEMARANYREEYLRLEFERRDDIAQEEIEAEDGLNRENSTEDGMVDVNTRDTGLATLTKALEEMRAMLASAIQEETHLLIRCMGAVYLIRPIQLFQRRARHYLSGHDLLSMQELEFELRHVHVYDQIKDPVLRGGDGSQLATLKDDLAFAVNQQCCVQIDYSASTSERTVRTLSCIHDSTAFGIGYLGAWCHLRQGSRTFKIDRINSYKVLALMRPWILEDGPEGARIIQVTEW